MKAIQFFTPEYLNSCRKMKPEQIAQFLEDFRQLHGEPRGQVQKSKLISMKVNESLLKTFKYKCEIEKTRYQTQIKKLMQQWLDS